MKTNQNYTKKIFLTILLSISFMVAFPDRTIECKPVAGFGSYTGACSISKSELTIIKSLTCTCDENTKYEILSFELSINLKGQVMVINCLGGNLSVEAKATINKATVGSKIFIDNIKVKDPTGKVKNVAGLTITVKA
jgi:hypothetical protein